MPTVPCSSHILLLGLACTVPGSIRLEAHTSFLALLVTVLASLIVPNPPPYIRIHAHARSYTTSFLQSLPYLHPRSNAQLTFVHENTCASTVYTHAQRTYAHILAIQERYVHTHMHTLHTRTHTHTRPHTYTQTLPDPRVRHSYWRGGRSHHITSTSRH